MGKAIRLFVGLFLAAVSCKQGICADEAAYLPQTIIEGKWGSQSGEFGFSMVEGEIICPTKITIDNLGNIFILDRFNNRVQKYDKNGHYTTSIPIESFKKNWFYDEKGMITHAPNDYNTDIAIDTSNDLHFLTIPENGKRKIKTFRNGNEAQKEITIDNDVGNIFVNDEGKVSFVKKQGKEKRAFEIKSSTEIVSLGKSKKTRQGNLIGEPSAINESEWRIPVVLKGNGQKDIVVNCEDKISHIEILGHDKNDALYILCVSKKGTQYVFVYSKSFELIAKIKGEQGAVRTGRMTFDKAGNVYQLLIASMPQEQPENAVKVIKWERTK